MINAINCLKALLFTVTIGLSAFSYLEVLPSTSSTLQQCSSAIQQRTLFAKVLCKALCKSTVQGQNYTLIEQKLAQLYDIALSSDFTLDHAVKELVQALKNSPWNIKEFFLGASSSAYQIEGGLDSNSAVARFYQKMELSLAGDSIDFFNRYAEDIRQLKEELHINCFRLSLAWNRIEPLPGQFNEKAM